jgi:hypothetical protein
MFLGLQVQSTKIPAIAAPVQKGLMIAAEITRRQERQAALARARAEIEARAHARHAARRAEQEAKPAQRAVPGGREGGGSDVPPVQEHDRDGA